MAFSFSLSFFFMKVLEASQPLERTPLWIISRLGQPIPKVEQRREMLRTRFDKAFHAAVFLDDRACPATEPRGRSPRKTGPETCQ